jgi:hypothetical protein
MEKVEAPMTRKEIAEARKRWGKDVRFWPIGFRRSYAATVKI